MYLHAKTSLAFLANPRTASRATAKALLGIGFVMYGSHHSGFGARGRRPGCAWGTFTTVRDEGELVESWARHLGCTPEEVPGMMPRERPIIEGWGSGYLPHQADADYWLQYASLEQDLNRLLGRFGLGPVELERIG